MMEKVCVLGAASRRRARVIRKVAVGDSGEMSIAPVRWCVFYLYVDSNVLFLVICAQCAWSRPALKRVARGRDRRAFSIFSFFILHLSSGFL
jgi:hypothetical protein